MDPLGKLKSRPGYKWVIVACCFAMVMICLGFCSSTAQMYLAATTEALGIERSLYSVGTSFRAISFSVVNAFFGFLVMKFGPRKLIGAGFACLIGSSLAYAMADDLALIYVGGALLGIGLSWTTTTMVAYVVHHWCKENKATIMSAILAANGLGGAIAAQVLSPMINADVFGYRTARYVTAVILLVLGIIVVLLFKNEPDGVERQAQQKKKAKAGTWSGIEFQECLRKPWFYLTLLSIVVCGLALTSSNGVYIAHMKDVGLDAGYIATIVSVHSLALALFKFLTGVVYDRFGLRVAMSICCISGVLSCLLLASVSNTEVGMVLAMSQGIIGSMAQPLETVMIPLIASELFGEKSYVKVLGIMMSIKAVGGAIGSPIINMFYDAQGTYIHVLMIAGIAMTAAYVIFLVAQNAAYKFRDRIMQENEA